MVEPNGHKWDDTDKIVERSTTVSGDLRDAFRALLRIIDAIERHHPDWCPVARSADTAHGGDVRREYFGKLQTALVSSMLARAFLAGDAVALKWWEENQWLGFEPDSEVEPLVAEVALAFEFTTDWSLLHEVSSITESALRDIVRSAHGRFGRATRRSFTSICARILKETNLEEFAPLFRIVRNVRNTVHNNGVFLPDDGQDDSVQYKGVTFGFTHGLAVRLPFRSTVTITHELQSAMYQIMESTAVANLSSCPASGSGSGPVTTTVTRGLRRS